MKWLMGSGSLMGFKYKHFLIICFCLLILAGSIYVLLPEIIFFTCLMTDDGGKLNSFESISDYVKNNQGILEEISIKMLSQGETLDISVEEDEIAYLDGSEEGETDLLQDEIISELFAEQSVQEIGIYKNENVQVIVFRTYAAGLGISGSMGGFFYYTGDDVNEILEYHYFNYYSVEIQEITDNLFYFEAVN